MVSGLSRCLSRSAVAMMVAGGITVLPSPASATVDPNCDYRPGGPVQLFWDQGFGGASICLNNTVWDMSSPATYFPYNGTGGGSNVWDNAASGVNLDTAYCATVWSDPGGVGSRIDFAKGGTEGSARWSLGAATNRNSSLTWYGC